MRRSPDGLTAIHGVGMLNAAAPDPRLDAPESTVFRDPDPEGSLGLDPRLVAEGITKATLIPKPVVVAETPV